MISTKGKYGLRAAVELAVREGQGPVSLTAIAEEQGISEPYLEQLMRLLKNAGLVKAVRGKAGGYCLARAAEDISAGELLLALEGTTSITDCVGTDADRCLTACDCAARPLFLTLQERIDGVLDHTTLEDLKRDYQQQKKRTEHAESLS